MRHKLFVGVILSLSLLASVNSYSSDRVFSSKKIEAYLKCPSPGKLEIVRNSNPSRYICSLSKNKTYYTPGRSCLRIAGIGYSLVRKSGKWQCCGRNPTGESCVNFADKIGLVTAGVCPASYTPVNSSDKSKLCKRTFRKAQFARPQVVIKRY